MIERLATASATKRSRRMWTLASCLMVMTGCSTLSPSHLMAVNVAVCDLRAQPHTSPQHAGHDPLEETQLLYGEPVKLVKTQEGWARIEAIEQQEFTHAERWEGYPGWMPASLLVPWEPLLSPNIVVTETWAQAWEDAYLLQPSSWRFALGTRLRATDMGGHLWKVELLNGSTVWMAHTSARSLEELHALSPLEKRRAILRSAERFLGEAYYWGGRSPHGSDAAGQVHGVDCSGLVNLAYRSVGIDIPRDAHEQFLRARSVNSPQPGDLIFLSEAGNSTHIVHVMLFAGNGEVIEGPGTGLAVRRISLVQRLGQSLDWLAPGAVVAGQTVYFGSYLP